MVFYVPGWLNDETISVTSPVGYKVGVKTFSCNLHETGLPATVKRYLVAEALSNSVGMSSARMAEFVTGLTTMLYPMVEAGSRACFYERLCGGTLFYRLPTPLRHHLKSQDVIFLVCEGGECFITNQIRTLELHIEPSEIWELIIELYFQDYSEGVTCHCVNKCSNAYSVDVWYQGRLCQGEFDFVQTDGSFVDHRDVFESTDHVWKIERRS